MDSLIARKNKLKSIVAFLRGRSEVFRGLAKCQAVPSEGSAVLCATEDPVGSVAEGVFSYQ